MVRVRGDVPAISFGLFFFGPGGVTDALASVLLAVTLVGIPVATAIAIFKYRLYDIDVVIRKTVVFGALAVFITAVYVGIVVGIGTAIGTRGEPSVGLSILATAVVAVAFQPVRERVQRVANRLVYGERATPYEALSTFASTMATSYAADDLLPRMTEVMVSGTGASRAEVWLKVDETLHRAAEHPPGASVAPVLQVPDGQLPEIPGATRSVPVRHRGELLGALSLTKALGAPVTPAEGDLLADLAAQAGLVLRNVSLITELKASRQRIVAAQDEERRRLERDIHDGAQQRLVGLAIRFGLLERLANDEQDRGRLGTLRTESQEALQELRDLARGIFPPLLADQGLVIALRAQAGRVPLPVQVHANGVGRYRQDVEAAVYFCVLEALQNVTKYAEASGAVVHLTQRDGWLEFDVEDDGRGFDPGTTGWGSGLQNMTDRIEALGGAFDVRTGPGAGTTVSCRLPVPVLESVA